MTDERSAIPPDVRSAMADALAAKVAPRFAAILDARKEDVVAKIPGPVRREALRLVWPVILDEIPVFTDIFIQLARDEFGHMDVNELLDFLGKR